MKGQLAATILMMFLISYTFAESKYWELKQGELEQLIKNTDVIVSGKFTKLSKGFQLNISSVLQGPQRLKSLFVQEKFFFNEIIQDSSYICFLKKKNNSYIPTSKRSLLKSDIFLSSRVYKEVMKWRVKRSQAVAVATVKKVQEFPVQKGNMYLVEARCELVKLYKGDLPKTFTVRYYRKPKAVPPTVFLFENISYIFFLKSKSSTEYELISPYEGAYLQRFSVLRQLKLVTNLENKFDELAGKMINGLTIYARLGKSQIRQNEDVTISALLQNISKQKIEVYDYQVHNFILLHIINEKGKLVSVKYPRKNSVPHIHRRCFLALSPGAYSVFPPLSLKKYCNLKPGKYSIYLEYHIPDEYTGKTIGKSAWSGKLMSKRMELSISEE